MTDSPVTLVFNGSPGQTSPMPINGLPWQLLPKDVLKFDAAVCAALGIAVDDAADYAQGLAARYNRGRDEAHALFTLKAAPAPRTATAKPKTKSAAKPAPAATTAPAAATSGPVPPTPAAAPPDAVVSAPAPSATDPPA